MMRLVAIAALVILTCALSPKAVEPAWTPPFAMLATTQPMWTREYHNAESCSHKKGIAEQVKWFVVQGKDFRCPTGRCIGWTDIVDHRIYIASDWLTTAWIFRHESVHDITGLGHESDSTGSPAAGDVELWGKACKAMWGYLETTPGYVP